MAANVSGVKRRVIPQAEESGVMDRFGVDTLTRVEEIPADLFPQGMQPVGTPHPRYRNMAVSKINYTKEKHGQFYRVSYIYEGFMVGLPEPTYDLDESNSEEPIQTHPNFADFAGTPSAPLNGAVFIDPETGKPTTDDDVGVFREFGIAGGRKAGVQSYVANGALWIETSYSTTRPSSVGDVGTIETPSGSPPTIGTSRNWLLWSIAYRKRGGIYETRKTWRCSGVGGWDTDIYDG